MTIRTQIISHLDFDSGLDLTMTSNLSSPHRPSRDPAQNLTIKRLYRFQKLNVIFNDSLARVSLEQYIFYTSTDTFILSLKSIFLNYIFQLFRRSITTFFIPLSRNLKFLQMLSTCFFNPVKIHLSCKRSQPVLK